MIRLEFWSGVADPLPRRMRAGKMGLPLSHAVECHMGVALNSMDPACGLCLCAHDL